ncbi:MAG: hemerythrin domain-containing protein [Kofleriaceae bacterium]|nr:hemerythrin domain-containing protein [Kofleriaceae bacterium]
MKGETDMPTPLLNDDGTASMATMFMSSHYGFRRDLAAFARALDGFTGERGDALRKEWAEFHAALHGHHTVEDTTLFPDLRGRHPELGTAIDELDEHHRAIDPLLARGDAAFANLNADVAPAREVIGRLIDLIATHLDAEERVVIPQLRGAKQFPQLPEAAMAEYAKGFAWSTAGLAGAVVAQIEAMLPPALVAALPAAREAFAARCIRVWGQAHTGSSVTSVPA